MINIVIHIFIATLCSLLFLTSFATALVSENRPGVPYFGQVLFLQKKVIENDKVVAASLAYADPRDNMDLCLNRIDVFSGLEKFRDIPENKWVLVDFELQSILIAEGFAGDADVSWVVACPDVDTCLEMGEKRSLDPNEQQRRAEYYRPKVMAKVNLEDISQRLEVGRKLVKSARCRGCHNIEGTGPELAPSLTWRRIKYERNWLKSYLKAPYRMRPGMDNLMMLNYTSPNAMPSMKQMELEIIADFMEHVSIASAPSNDQRKELWEDYDCYNCHVKLYKSEPLAFQPTSIPDNIKENVKSSSNIQLCMSCHAFGDLHITGELPTGSVNAFAPDLLLAFEKLNPDFISSFLENPAYLVPASKMPNLELNDDTILEIRNFAQQIKKAIATGEIKPIYIYYEMEKRTTP